MSASQLTHLERQLLEVHDELRHEVARHEKRRQLRTLFRLGFLIALIQMTQHEMPTGITTFDVSPHVLRLSLSLSLLA